MNLKNKIFLTIIAIIFALCLFNTCCFASTENSSEIVLPTFEEYLSDYPYYIVVENPNYYLVLLTDKVLSATVDDSNYTLTLCHSSSDISYCRLSISKENLNNGVYTFTITGQDIYSGAYNFNYTALDSTPVICASNYSISLFNDSSVFFDKSPATFVEKTETGERGTEDDTNTDSGETGNETTGGDSETDTDSDDSSGILSSITKGFENVVNFFTQLVEFVGNILSYLNPFSDNFILKGVLNFLGEILSYINPFSENFFGKKLMNLLGELLESLFKPNQDIVSSIPDLVSSKFGFIDTIKTSANNLKELISNVGTAPKLTININNNKYGVEELTIIDLSWYKPYKVYGDLILSGFIYAFFLWRLFISVPNIINGSAGSVQDTNKVIEIGGKK